MANRLEQISTSITSKGQNRIIDYRLAFPLDRTHVRNLIYGEKYRLIVDRSFDLMLKNKHIFKHGDIQDYNRPQERQSMAKMVLAYHKLRAVNTLNIDKDPSETYFTAHATYNFDPALSVRTDITLFLYTKTILNFHRPESQVHRKFVIDGLSAKDIGCFGLTQIGHGSDTKNVETEAHYNHETKTFILNTPTETGLKFWIGGSAETANMALIWAQLFIKGKKYGVHPFVVPIRDKKTMTLYKGVKIGDCGSKIGLQSIDNGYIGFDHYSIPAENLLDRISGVDEKGEFRAVEPSLDKRHGLYMGSLSLGRAFITINAISACINSLLIGIKYSCVRRQFQAPNKSEQQLIIDYPLIRFRLMPQLATSFMYFMTGAHILKLYGKNNKEIIDPKSKLGNEMHAISAAAKAKASWYSSEVIGSIRHLLGGHGYSSFSRLGRLYFDQDVNTTWEGDNHMLLQQTTKYALKTVQKLKANPDPKNLINFVTQQITLPEINRQSLQSLDVLQKIFQTRFIQIHDQMFNYMIELKGKELIDMDVWNYSQPYYGKKLANLFCDLFYIQFLKQKIATFTGPLKEISENCFRLWLFTSLEKEKWSTQEIRSLLQQLIKELCDWLTPRSISLVECLAAPQEIIGSPFADHDGDKMWQKYLGLVYTGKDAFGRVPYYQNIIDGRNAKPKGL